MCSGRSRIWRTDDTRSSRGTTPSQTAPRPKVVKVKNSFSAAAKQSSTEKTSIFVKLPKTPTLRIASNRNLADPIGLWLHIDYLPLGKLHMDCQGFRLEDEGATTTA
jgi:hypothetical protein